MVKHSLPSAVSSFVGRVREQAELRGLLRERRLVTLTGPPGVGKSRLALRVCDQLSRSFTGGVRHVDLSPVHSSASLAQAVAGAFGSAARTVPELADELAGGQRLIMLDNGDHLIGECADLVRRLLGALPELHLIVTSRQVLAMPGEQVVSLLPLAVTGASDLNSVLRLDAVALFLDRAQADDPGFVVDEQNWREVLTVCRRVDGVPLAIELAAAWLRVMSLAELVARLGDRLGILVGGRRGPATERSGMTEAIRRSDEQCSPDERLMWARLSVFAGVFDLAAAEALCPDAGVIAGLAALVDKSLLQTAHRPDGARYHLLGIMSDYGIRMLSRAGSELVTRERHLAHCVRTALAAEAAWRSGSRQPEALAVLRSGAPEFRSALEFSLGRPEHHDDALQLAAALHPLWLHGGASQEGGRWLAEALASSAGPGSVRSKALWVGAHAACLQGDEHTATVLAQRCLETSADAGEEAVSAALLAQACVAMAGGDKEGAVLLYGQAAVVGNSVVTPLATVCLAMNAVLHGEFAFAATLAGAALDRSPGLDDRWAATYLRYVAVLAAQHLESLADGVEVIAESLQSAAELDDANGFAALADLGALVAATRGDDVRSVAFAGVARRTWRQVETKSLVGSSAFLRHHEKCVREGISSPGDGGYDDVTVDGGGSAPTLRAAAAFLRGDSSATAPGRPAPTATRDDRLTGRERQVAALVCEGLTDRAIADRLGMAPRTAETHVQRTLRKLGFTSRSQLAAWVVESC